MAGKKVEHLSASDVTALLKMVAAPVPLAGDAERILDGLCKLLPARGVGVGQAPDRPPEAAARFAGAARDPTRTALADGDRCLVCVVSDADGSAAQFAFRRDPHDQPFGTRELAIVAVLARAGRMPQGWPRSLGGRGGFEGLDGAAAGRLGLGRFTARGLTAGEHATGSSSVLENLPPRQRQVLHRLRGGASDKEVARSLGLSIHTVREHIKRLHVRFDVHSRGELFAFLLRGGAAVRPDAPGRQGCGD